MDYVWLIFHNTVIRTTVLLGEGKHGLLSRDMFRLLMSGGFLMVLEKAIPRRKEALKSNINKFLRSYNLSSNAIMLSCINKP